MAESPASQHRTNLIRQMAQDLRQSRPISISSRASDSNSNIDIESMSEFDPSADGVGSTRQIDEQSQRLPEYQPNSQTYSHPASAPEPDYRINTSALGRAFPNFSRSASERDEDSSRSIELGRGHYEHNSTNNDHSSVAFDNNFAPSLGGPTSKKEGATSFRRSLNSGRRPLEKETSGGSPPTVKATDYGSNGSRQSSGGRIKAPEDDNLSRLSEDRPSTVNITSRSSRFSVTSKVPASAPVGLPKNFTSSKDFMKNLSSAQDSKPAQERMQPRNPTVTSAQSYTLPELPNISELISGTFIDGTPMFSRHTKARGTSGPTRFASAHQGRKSRVGHYPVGEIAVPQEEEAIFVSLKLLQEKIADLENKRSEQEAHIQSLQERNKILEFEKVEIKRLSSRDSGFGHTSGSDGDDEFARKSRKSVIERNRLETTIRTLQDQLDVAAKKVRTSEITIKNLSSERDSAISQLGVAYVNMEQLKLEKEALLGQIAALKAEIFALRHEPVQASEVTSEDHGKTRDSLERATSRESGPTARQDYTQLLDIDANVHEKSRMVTEQPPNRTASKDKQKKRKTRIVLEEYSESEQSEENVQNDTSRSQNEPKDKAPDALVNHTRPAKDQTVLSTIGSGRFMDLRQLLERERNKQRYRYEESRNLEQEIEPRVEAQRVEATPVEPQLPKKSSMKNLKGRSEDKAEKTSKSQKDANLTSQSKVSEKVSRPRNASSHEHRSKRQSVTIEDMTSAFIVPDITIGNPGEATMKLSQSAREVFDHLAQHDSHSCTICKRVIEHERPHEHGQESKSTIPKPVPVSERRPLPGPEDDEPTMRPSQPPAVALAAVLKELEDEVKHLKIKQSAYHAQYICHDPALSKRKRHAVAAEMDRLQKVINVKSDQIYALYDVLEGQKQSGQQMSEEEVEVTLSKIGVDFREVGMRGGNIDTDVDGGGADSEASFSGRGGPRVASTKRMSKQAALTKKDGKKAKQVWDLDSDEDDELPWEGFDRTGELTGRSGSLKKKVQTSSS